MYASTLSIYGFRCFGKAVLQLRHPDRAEDPALELPNVNLILGDNGGGKSSVLRAVAIAALAPALLESGFVAYRMVRRGSERLSIPDAKECLLKLVCTLDEVDRMGVKGDEESIELLARIDRRGDGNVDRLHLERTPDSPIEQLVFDDRSHMFFVVGYGATRRTETGDYSESSARRSRGLRYVRVAGLFEDHVALRPLQAWLPNIKGRRRTEAIAKINALLPENIRFDGKIDKAEGQYLFDFDGTPTPFTSLSDGYKAFIGWCGDLIAHLCDVAPASVALDAISGIVLVDEIDLHLHPAWQRVVLSALSRTFPRLQFIVTSHSPLIASAVRKENVFVTDTADDGTATIKQIEEKVFGRGADQLLLSSYFGLTTVRSPEFVAASENLFAKAAGGDTSAAVTYLRQLAAPTSADQETLPEVSAALGQASKPSARTATDPARKATAKRATKR